MNTPSDGSLFAADWLTLREPVDHRSRPAALAYEAARWLRRGQRTSPCIADLGCGRGSNTRNLAPFMPSDSQWRLLDHDAGLLAQATDDLRTVIPASRIDTRQCDLAAALGESLADCDVITAAALLDLVSADWIDQLAAMAQHQRAALLCAISVDGHIRFMGTPDPEDAAVLQGLARDQQRDKGLGAALGTHAPCYLINALAARGFAVTSLPSAWLLDAGDAPLAQSLLAGWASAAAGNQTGRFDRWAARRSQAIAAGLVCLQVGHVDVLGLPPS